MFSFMDCAKVVCLLLMAGATVCFALGPSQPDPGLVGGCPGCIDYPTASCADFKDPADPLEQTYCCGNYNGLCNVGEGGNPNQVCTVTEHHCSTLPPGQSPFCETLYFGFCQ